MEVENLTYIEDWQPPVEPPIPEDIIATNDEAQPIKPLTPEVVAEDFIYHIWRCADSKLKNRYGMHSWSIFSSFVYSSACKPSLPEFLDQLNRLLPMEWYPENYKAALAFIASYKDADVLKIIRSQNAYLILIVRAKNTEAKEAYLQEKDKKKAAKTAAPQNQTLSLF